MSDPASEVCLTVGYRMKFMDGTPVTEEYAKALAVLIQQAANGDPGENAEGDDDEQD